MRFISRLQIVRWFLCFAYNYLCVVFFKRINISHSHNQKKYQETVLFFWELKQSDTTCLWPDNSSLSCHLQARASAWRIPSQHARGFLLYPSPFLCDIGSPLQNAHSCLDLPSAASAASLTWMWWWLEQVWVCDLCACPLTREQGRHHLTVACIGR